MLKLKGELLAESAYKTIYNLINDRNIVSGDIISISDLESHTKLGRAPIRDALTMLCSEGVFKSIPRLGYELIPIEENDLIEMIKYRIVIECGFLNYYWDKIQNVHYDILKEILANTKVQSNQSTITEWENNCEFHLSLFKLHSNTHATMNLTNTMNRMKRFYINNYWSIWKEITKESLSYAHENVIKNIINNRKKEAIFYLEKDIDSFKR